ncbi:MAG: hypothetical protein HDR71_00465 [Lachnospiraceae bacterium]|nr:hypothetical protein [Lachnospiraceae bacterium]
MVERGLYYAAADFAQMIKNNGGTWNDTKHRPIVCLIKSKEHDRLYWAIPMGKTLKTQKTTVSASTLPM